MKTKEIDVWVDFETAQGKWKSTTISTQKNAEFICNKYPLKAKLIIELPEQKIEITESDLISAYKKSMDGHESYPLLSKMLKELGFVE